MDQINEDYLNNLPVGSVVNDGFDNWHKQPDGLWTCEFALDLSSSTYYAWTSTKLVNRYEAALTLVKRGGHEFVKGQRVKHNGSGLEYTVSGTDAKGWLHFEGYSDVGSFDPTFFSPVEPEEGSAEETEAVQAFSLSAFRKGDLVTDVILTWNGEVNYVEVARAKEPEEPAKPKTGTRGTALVDGKRVSGMIDEDGDFKYLDFDGYYVESEYVSWSDDLEFIADTQED